MTKLDYTFERQLTLEREENIREGREQGREEGLAEGREHERIDALVRMLKVGIDEELILALGYSQNEIAIAKEQAANLY